MSALLPSPNQSATALAKFRADHRTTLTVKEAASILMCTGRHIAHLIEAGQLAAVNIANARTKSCWRISMDEMARFIESRSSLGENCGQLLGSK